ncbi:MAG: hypothetical protein CSA07_05570 [Bacteroidia bacterium]|nr:MAG: hypothetical protein CSA07_05570 [Bacteroidia bacterium]
MLTEGEVDVRRFGAKSLYVMAGGAHERLDGRYKIADAQGNYQDVGFSDGVKEGDCKRYDYKDRLLSEASYRDGRMEGAYRAYHQNGKVSQKGRYSSGQQEGEWLYYDDEGAKIAVEHYAGGKPTGEWWKLMTSSVGGGAGGWWAMLFEMHPEYKESAGGTVKVEEVSHYRDGKHRGRSYQRVVNGPMRWERDYEDEGTYTSKEYYPNGKLELEKRLRNHKLDGHFKAYTKAGVLVADRVFREDVLEHETLYWENGMPHYLKTYKHGELEGEYREWNEKGELISVGEYKGGSKSGLWKTYVPGEETLVSEILYKGGQPHGLAKFYSAANRVENQGEYVHGEKNGLWKRYDLAGKLREETEYAMGREVKRREYK